MDEDILALVSDEVHQPEKLWDVLDLQVGSRLTTAPDASCWWVLGRLSNAACLRSLLATTPVMVSMF